MVLSSDQCQYQTKALDFEIKKAGCDYIPNDRFQSQLLELHIHDIL